MAPQCHSLKEKRSVLRKIKDRTRSRFHLPVSEVGAQNTWQRLVLGFALVGSERGVVESSLASVVGFIEGMGVASVIEDEREVVTYGDARLGDEALSAGAGADAAAIDDDWIPDAWKDDGTDGPGETPGSGSSEPANAVDVADADREGR